MCRYRYIRYVSDPYDIKMTSHFLLSAKARTLSLAAVLRMTDERAETTLARLIQRGEVLACAGSLNADLPALFHR